MSKVWLITGSSRGLGLALADRVLVLEEGRVVHTLVIDDARRSPSDPSANTERYRAELLDKLGVRL